MRLWHQDLIPKLPRQQLLGQHRECCALRGNGWGKKHSTVDYVFKYGIERLIAYHTLVIDEMIKRGYSPDKIWENLYYRGKILGNSNYIFGTAVMTYRNYRNIYPEHNENYLEECINNLKAKGVFI